LITGKRSAYSIENKFRGDISMSIEFLITSLIVVLAPGTGVLYTLACGLSHGKRTSVAAAIGCTSGILPHIAASILGLAALLHTSALTFQLIKFAGVAYLLYMAWGIWRETGKLAIEENIKVRNLKSVAIRGFLINILNPKLSIFFLAFLPQFISPTSANPALAMAGLGGIFMAMTLAVFIVYGMGAASVRKHVISSPSAMTWIRRGFAGTFAAFGLKLAVTDR
jgi:threonine/homoserine/homoserine lactone efflux protein